MRFVVTFPVGGPLAGHWTQLSASQEHTARLALIGVYGTAGWAGIYPAGAEATAMIARYELTPVEFGFGYETAQEYAR